MAYTGDRDLLTRHNGRKTAEELDEYRAAKNARSLDGLPALQPSPARAPDRLGA
jgi:hypothetical protein